MPVRTCVGCRRAAPPSELVRVRWTPAGLATGAGPGRGAWLCRATAVECLDRIGQKRSLERALRKPVRNDDIARVRATLEASAGARASVREPGITARSERAIELAGRPPSSDG